MRAKDVALYRKLEQQLINFHKNHFPMPGIDDSINRNTFIRQLIDSIRRVKYVSTISQRSVSPQRANPLSDLFDPLKAAIIFKNKGMMDEAFWLIFFFVHFGKNLDSGWRLARDIYSGMGNSGYWTWKRTSSDPNAIKIWLKKNYLKLTGDGIVRRFGNHRKFETLNPNSPYNTADVVESYVKWVKPPRSHKELIEEVSNKVDGNPRAIFDNLYKSMNAVNRFGRLAKFDYLTMVGKLGLATIEPGSIYMVNSTGPIKGAILLFCGRTNPCFNQDILDRRLILLESQLDIGVMGMQVLEDALCNWQKSPQTYRLFRG